MGNQSVSRREFMKNMSRTAFAAAVAVPILNLDAQAASGKAPLPMQPIHLDLTKQEYAVLANTGGAVKIPNPQDAHRPIIVSRISETEVVALSSKCTHFGCEVELPKNNVIACPCHGSKFDAGGKVIHGPASKPLKAFSALLTGSVVTVKELES